MKKSELFGSTILMAGLVTCHVQAGLLAYEPFTNAPGTAIIGSSDGVGFSGSWQNNSSSGTATWISFIIARQGPTGTLAGNPYGRGANVPHDLNAENLQKLAIGNSSGASVNTVGLIPEGSSANLQSSTHAFGGATNFIVVRIDHVNSGYDNAYLFVNPPLASEPATGTAFADVAPIAPPAEPPFSGLAITNVLPSPGEVVLSGIGGSNGVTYHLLSSNVLEDSGTSWAAVATNVFDVNGTFSLTNPIPGSLGAQFFRLLVPPPPVPMIPPTITTEPQDLTVTENSAAAVTVEAEGSAPLHYQWYYYPNSPLSGATNETYTIASTQSNQTGDYFVVVTNAYGAVTSVVATLTVDPEPILMPGAYFVATFGSDSNPGTEEEPFLTLGKGLDTITTDGVLYVRGGTYAMPSKLSLTRTGVSNGSIRMWAYPGEEPVIDSAGNSSDGIRVSGDNYHLRGLTIINAGHNGINISGDSNIIEFCTLRANGNTGLHITGSQSETTFPAYNLILNCDSYLNYDAATAGENADGFTAKWDLGPGNVFSGCRAWWNSDDGWDLWMGNSPVLLTNCWAFWNGIDHWSTSGFSGDGNGIKLGGNYVGAPHRVLRCLAFENVHHGIDQNNNTAGQTIDHNTSWNNGTKNYYLDHGVNTTPHVVRNNMSFDGGNGDTFTSGTIVSNNSWQVITSPAVNASDLLSVDSAGADGPRNPDGSLPDLTFLHPVPGGRLIDQGVVIDLPYSGAAPDLGAFEDGL